MSECPYFEHLIIIPRLRVQNANAISSPLTHGFPAVSAFLGLMWALERKTQQAGFDLKFNAIGVVAHAHEEQTADSGYVNGFRLTRNPVLKSGKTAAIVEEGRIHLDISLMFAVESNALRDADLALDIVQRVRDIVSQMRVAGGTIVPSSAAPRRQRPFAVPFTGDPQGQQKLFNQLKYRLLPGFTLVERQDLLERRFDLLRQTNPDATRLDAWLSLARINWRWQAEEGEGEEGQWRHDRHGLGWAVPIPVGYGALTELQAAGSVANARDSTTPFLFVESLYGLGEWVSPHRLHSPEQMLWYADNQPDEGLYRCRNDYRPASSY